MTIMRNSRGCPVRSHEGVNKIAGLDWCPANHPWLKPKDFQTKHIKLPYFFSQGTAN